MNKPMVLIYSPTFGFLDGYDGDTYEWTPHKREAWRLREEEALRRLPVVLNQAPDAVIQNL